jgi:predicted unusual protein kinase regulating ubiquinone biosynthesis (AarF/ABC1/UbiB family)
MRQFGDGPAGRPPHDRIDKRSEREGVVAVRLAGVPPRVLRSDSPLDSLRDAAVLERDPPVEGGQARGMGQHMLDGDRCLPVYAEFGPELGDRGVDVQFTVLPQQQGDQGGNRLGHREDDGQGLVVPRPLRDWVGHARPQIDHHPSVNPDCDSSADLTPASEVLDESRLDIPEGFVTRAKGDIHDGRGAVPGIRERARRSVQARLTGGSGGGLVAPKGKRLLETLSIVGRTTTRQLVRRRSPSTLDAVVGAFQQLGATYVKLGQLLGSAPGVFGAEVSDAFRALLDTGPAVPMAEVTRIVEADLGRPVDEAFASFNTTPIAAASIAVVHWATLADGRDVAVKVLRPHIAETVDADIALLEPIVRFLARQGVETAAPIHQFLAGLQRQVAEELDLRNEARVMGRFRALYRESGLDRIVIPEVHPTLSGRNTLTMDFLRGVPIDDPALIGQAGDNPRELLLQLLKAWFITAVGEGVFHGDLHAGNLLLLDDSRLGLIDWGILGRLDPATHWVFRRMLEGCLGDESAWLDVAEVYHQAGVTMQDEFGLTPELAAAIVRNQLQPILTQPLGVVDLATLVVTSQDVARVIRPESAPTDEQESLVDRVRRIRASRRFFRRIVDQELHSTEFDRANFMLGKQLMYVERFGKMYLPDVALLNDRDFVLSLLAAKGPPSPLS